MPNPRWNDQTANKPEAEKSPTREGKVPTLSRPSFEQVKQTLPTQKSVAGNFQSTPEMVDKLD